MDGLRFVWDTRKAAANKRKHGITFEEATTVFLDEMGLIIPDPDHAQDETRFILLGLSSGLKVLVVCHCFREDGETIRIISARRATRTERGHYLDRSRR